MLDDSKKSDIYKISETLREIIERTTEASKEKFQALTKLEEMKMLIAKTELIESP